MFFFALLFICFLSPLYSQTPSNVISTSSEDSAETPTLTNNSGAGQTSDIVSTPAADSSKTSVEKKSPHTFSGYVSFVSDYRFRGISQTFKKPALQGNLEYGHESGLYVGTWASNVDGTTHLYNNTSLEWDFYLGFKGKFFPCFIPEVTYNVGSIAYYYPGGQAFNVHRTRFNCAELFFELTRGWLSVKTYVMLANFVGVCSDNPPFNWDTLTFHPRNGSSKGSTYIEANGNFDLVGKVCYGFVKGGKLNLVLHGGYQYVRHYNVLSYGEWRATLTQTFDWFNLFASYVGTNAKHAYYNVPDNAFDPHRYYLGAQAIVFGLNKTF